MHYSAVGKSDMTLF